MLDVMCLCVGAAATMLSLGIRANGICILCMDGACVERGDQSSQHSDSFWVDVLSCLNIQD